MLRMFQSSPGHEAGCNCLSGCEYGDCANLAEAYILRCHGSKTLRAVWVAPGVRHCRANLIYGYRLREVRAQGTCGSRDFIQREAPKGPVRR